MKPISMIGIGAAVTRRPLPHHRASSPPPVPPPKRQEILYKWAEGGRRPPAPPCHTTVRTGPYTAVRDGYASIPRIRTECGLGFRFQSSPRTAQPLPFP